MRSEVGVAEVPAESRQRQKNKKDPVKLVQKLVADPVPAKSEPLRQLIVSDTAAAHMGRLAEAHVVPSLLAVLTMLEGKPRKTGADNEVMADLLASLRALLQHPPMLQALLDSGAALVTVGCFDASCEMSVRVAAVALLRALAAAGALGVTQVVAAFDAFSKTRLERARFEHLVGLFESHPDLSVRFSVSQLAMRMLEGTSERGARVAIRNDLVNWGFKQGLAELAVSAPEEFRAKFAEQLEEFRRQQTADGGVMAGTNRRPRSASMTGTTGADAAATLVVGEGAAQAELPVSHLVQQTAAALASSSPKAALLLDGILENVLNGFGKTEASLWQWQCCERLTRMLSGLHLQHLNANFDAEPTAAASPETALANLLLGALMQDELQTLREDVFALRMELAQVASAAEMTITDLQAELEIARKLKARKRKVHKEKVTVLNPSASSPTPEPSSSGSPSAVVSPRGPALPSAPPASIPAPVLAAPASSPSDVAGSEEFSKSTARRLRHTLKKKKHPGAHARKASGPSGALAAPALTASQEVSSSDNETLATTPNASMPSTPEKTPSAPDVPATLAMAVEAATPPSAASSMPPLSVPVTPVAAAAANETEDSGDSDSD